MNVNVIRLPKTPLLRIFAVAVSFCGVQLLPVNQWKNPKCLLATLLNGGICLFVINWLYPRISPSDSSHSLFSYFFRFYSYVLFPGIETGITLTFFCFGYRLMQCLDSPIFYHTLKQTRSQALSKFAGIYLVFLTVYTTSRLNTLNEVWLHPSQRNGIIRLAVFFAFYTQLLAIWFILYYHQIGTYVTLKKLCQNFVVPIHRDDYSSMASNTRHALDNRLYRLVRNLARHNRRIQSLYFWLLFISLINDSGYLINHFYRWFILGFEQRWNKILEEFIRLSLWFGICCLNVKILQTFDEIQHYLCGRGHRHQDLQEPQNRGQRKMNGDRRHRHGRFNQIKIYRECFLLSSGHYQLARIDSSFMLNMVFYSLGYFVLISQTR